MKNNNGITIVALIITIVVLIIIAGISVGSITGSKGTLKVANDEMLVYELDEVLQAVLELKVKYNQTESQSYLEGTKISYEDANTLLQEINEESSEENNIVLKIEEDSIISDYDSYYKLVKADLKHMGLANSEDEYVVNYSTGEVFNITSKTTSDGKPLYVNAH